MTALESCFTELSGLGEEQRKLAEYLRNLRKNHEIETIIDIIQEVGHE